MRKVLVLMLALTGLLVTSCSTLSEQEIVENRNLNERLNYDLPEAPVVLYRKDF